MTGHPGTTDQQPDTAEQDGEEAPLPSFTEQIADQLGGVRGLVESSIPVAVFVIVNILWTMRPAVLLAVGSAVAIGIYRLTRRESIRHAINGVFGVMIGGVIAWKTGEPRDFYLPGILFSLLYAVAMLGSVMVRRPLVGWLWSVVIAKGSMEWRKEPRLVRTFGWLTAVWAAIYLVKVAVQGALYLAHAEAGLGVARLALGYPPYFLLLALTVWAVRRVTRQIETEPAN